MTDTITALDTASTGDLVAALMARLRARLAMSAGPLEGEDQVRAVAWALGGEGMQRYAEATNATVEAFLAEHPATAPPPQMELPPGFLPFPFGLLGGGVAVMDLPTASLRFAPGGGAGEGPADPLEALKGRLLADLRQVEAQLPGGAGEAKGGKRRRKKGKDKRG